MAAQAPGRFITLEGIEGAGKSTVARLLATWLEARGVRVCQTREPGGTPLAEKLRDLVLTPGAERIPPEAETLLMFAARGIHLANLVRPALAQGRWVICDRFTDATRAYQGAGRGLDAALIESLAAAVHGDLAPHCTLLLDLPVAVGLARAKARNAGADRFERERAPFFERVRAGYLELARRFPERIHLIDAAAPLEAVETQVRTLLTRLYGAELPAAGDGA